MNTDQRRRTERPKIDIISCMNILNNEKTKRASQINMKKTLLD